jgi:hypothetical protein
MPVSARYGINFPSRATPLGSHEPQGYENLPEAYQLPKAVDMKKSILTSAHSGYKSYADKYINRIRQGSQDIDTKSRRSGINSSTF